MKNAALATTLFLTTLACQADDGLSVFVTEPDGNPARLVISSATLAAAAGAGADTMAATEKPNEFETRWFTANKLHQYLGIGSLLAAAGAAVTPKEEDGAHHSLGEASAILGGLAVLTGLGFHYEDLTWKGGMKDPDNLHALLTTLGTLGFALAVSDAPEGGHAGAGIAGAFLMLGGIKVNW